MLSALIRGPVHSPALARPACDSLRGFISGLAPPTSRLVALPALPSSSGVMASENRRSKADLAGDPDEVLVEKSGSVAVVTLNRPKALNSLNTNMVERLLDLYAEYDKAPWPSAVVLKGSGGKAFCAGGDVKAVVEHMRAGEAAEAARFFKTEYRMNFALSQLRKPHVALLDGVTMGGGVGVSVHGAFRVATEKTLFAMPELVIGLFPDVGASYFLPRLPGQLGLYLALTGARLKGEEVKAAGIATHFVPSAAVPKIEAELVAMPAEEARDHSKVDGLLRAFEEGQQQPAGAGGILQRLSDIDDVFGQGNLMDVLEDLESRSKCGDEWASETLSAIRKGSPWSAHVTFEMVRRGAHLSVAQCLEMEHGLAQRICYSPGKLGADFVEGVRALLIDKDGSATWAHKSAGQVPMIDVQVMFAPMPEGEALGLTEGFNPGGAGSRSSL